MTGRHAPAEERFWRMVDKRGPDECWPWLGSIGTKMGYGLLNVEGRSISAHRFSFLLYYGEIPGGAHILHTCDNPPCVNPTHLRSGTNADNVADKVSRKRHLATCPTCGQEVSAGGGLKVHAQAHDHPERCSACGSETFCKGLCSSCYHRSWKQAKKARSVQESALSPGQLSLFDE